MNHREFLGLVVANKCQMSSDINILYHSYKQWLKYQTFTAFQVKFHVSGSIINFPCVIPSKMAYSFIISNASRSMHCSSVEAYLLWKCCSVSNRIVSNSVECVNIWQQNVATVSNMCSVSHQKWCPTDCMGYFTCINIFGRKSVQ